MIPPLYHAHAGNAMRNLLCGKERLLCAWELLLRMPGNGAWNHDLMEFIFLRQGIGALPEGYAGRYCAASSTRYSIICHYIDEKC